MSDITQNPDDITPSLDLLFAELEKTYKGDISESVKKRVTKAYNYAKDAHKDQKRYSGEPYFKHVFMAGLNAAKFGMGSVTVAAALLHDVIEDVGVTKNQLIEEFGEDIAFLVEGVSKLGVVKYRGRERHIESLRKFFVASAQDVRVVIIKLADRLHNIQTLQHVPAEKQKRIALETIELFAPLAWRLGMGRLATELQDQAFEFAYPKEYQNVLNLLKQRKKTDEKYIDKIYKSLNKKIAEASVSNFQVSSRIKSKYSLYTKLVRKDMDIDKIYDIIALRVIVPSIEDCYKVLGIIHSTWRPLPGRIKDYIALPKPNGYKSIHTTIFTGDGGITEIQIRTKAMHAYAEYGIAAHYLYKETDKDKDKQAPNYGKNWVTELGALQNTTKNHQEFLKNLTTDFFQNRIFVFTPLGDVVDLPKGAAVIDFAYAIHSDIGNHATGAKINGKYIALKKPLRNGDIVEIETKDSAHPSGKWMDYAKTTMARKQIQKYVRDHSLMKSVQKWFGK